MNRIGHPDWVKLCIESNCASNQNTFCYTYFNKSLFLSAAEAAVVVVIVVVKTHLLISSPPYIYIYIYIYI